LPDLAKGVNFMPFFNQLKKVTGSVGDWHEDE
jgi:hypothetical protein